MYLEPYQIAELIALIITIVYLKKIKGTSLVVLVPFLFAINVYEFGTLKGWFTINGTNHFVANIFMIIHFLFYLALLSTAFSEKKVRKKIFASAALLLLAFTLNFNLFQKKYSFNSYTYIFGAVIIITWCCYMFYCFFKRSEKISLTINPFFWIYGGVLMYYLIRFTFISYFEIVGTSFNVVVGNLYGTLATIAIFFLYSCITIGIICLRSPITKV